MNKTEKDIWLCFALCSITNLAIATTFKDMLFIYSIGFVMLYITKKYQSLYPVEFIQDSVESDKVKE